MKFEVFAVGYEILGFGVWGLGFGVLYLRVQNFWGFIS